MGYRLDGDVSNYFVQTLDARALAAVANTWVASNTVRFISFGSGNTEVITLYDNPNFTFTAGSKGVSVQVTSAGVLRLVTIDSAGTLTVYNGGTLALNTTYRVLFSRLTGSVFRVDTQVVGSTAAPVSQILTSVAFTMPSVSYLATQTQSAGQSYYSEHLSFRSNQIGNSANVAALARVPDLQSSLNPLIHNNAFRRNHFRDGASTAAVWGAYAAFATQQFLTAFESQAKHHRVIRPRLQVGAPVVSTVGAGTRCGAFADITPPFQPIASTANTNTAASAAVSVDRATASAAATNTAASASVGVDRAVTSSAAANTSASAAVGSSASVVSSVATNTTATAVSLDVTRAVASTAATNTAASAAVSGAAAVASATATNTAASAAVSGAAAVASTAATTTTGTAQAGSGVISTGTTSTGASASVLVERSVTSAAATNTAAATNLVQPVTSSAATNTAASAAVSGAAAVASTAATNTTATAVSVLQSSAVASSSATNTGQSASIVRDFAVTSTSATSTAAAAAVQSARAITSSGATQTDTYAGVGVLIVKPIDTSYYGAANSFCGAPAVSVYVGLTAPPTARKREWPYHPR